MSTAVVLIESDIKVKDNKSECYIKMGKGEVNTGEFTTEKQKLMRPEHHMEQLMLVISGKYQNIYPGFPGAVIHHKRQKIPLNPTTKTLMNFMSPFLTEI